MEDIVERLDYLTGIGGYGEFRWACGKILFEEFALALVPEEVWTKVLEDGNQFQLEDVFRIAEEKKVSLTNEEAVEVLTITRRIWDEVTRSQRKPIPLAHKLKLLTLPKLCGYKDDPWAKICGSTENLEYGHIRSVKNAGLSTEDNLMWMCEGHNRQLGGKNYIWSKTI